MKLIISKNKDNTGYYSKITNEYNNEKTEMYLSVQLGKNIPELEYGMYEVDGFLSCYKGKDGSVKPKLIITSAKPTTKYEKKDDTKVYTKEVETNDVFQDFGDSIEVTDNLLD